MKYNFHEVKEHCLRTGDAVPVDINASIEKLVTEKIKDPSILADLVYCREKKKFGVYKFDEVFSAEFKFGIIKMAWFFIQVSSKGSLEGSVKNTNVEFSKPNPKTR